MKKKFALDAGLREGDGQVSVVVFRAADGQREILPVVEIADGVQGVPFELTAGRFDDVFRPVLIGGRNHGRHGHPGGVGGDFGRFRTAVAAGAFHDAGRGGQETGEAQGPPFLEKGFPVGGSVRL